MKTTLFLSVTLCVAIIAACGGGNSGNPTGSGAVQSQNHFTATINGVQWTTTDVGASYGKFSTTAPPSSFYFTIINGRWLANAQNTIDSSSFFQFAFKTPFDPVKDTTVFDSTTQWQLYESFTITLQGVNKIYYPQNYPNDTLLVQAHVTNDTIIAGMLTGTFYNPAPPHDTISITNGSFRASGNLHP